MICHSCLKRSCRVTGGNVHFVIWGCPDKAIRFGDEPDYKLGKNMPGKCADYLGSFLIENQAMNEPKIDNNIRRIERLKEAIRK
jgi:hypothetical protein